MFDFIIIGAAQAGLAMAYYLKEAGYHFLILDKEEEIGASWLNRWDSLKLFTPTEFNHLPGMDFPAEKGHYPSKTEVANYFKIYAENLEFPLQLNTLVTSVKKEKSSFYIETENQRFESKNVIIATGPFHVPYTPPFHKKISSEIFQIHSNYYKNVAQLKEGNTLVVGAGDSGFQILDEISALGQKTYFSGATDVKVLPQEFLGKTLWWWFTKTGFLSFNKDSWIGKRISKSRQPIIGTDVKEILSRKNVEAVGKTIDAEDDLISTEKKEITNIANIVWATGYQPNFNWIDGLELTKDGYPKHKRGISNTKGLYFIGLPWLHTRGSATLGGIKNDAKFLFDFIENQPS